MAFYVTTRLRKSSPQPQRDAYAPRTMWLLGRPQIGEAMALVHADGQSLITSRIQRILHGPRAESVYVQTHNSTYELRQAPLDS